MNAPGHGRFSLRGLTGRTSSIARRSRDRKRRPLLENLENRTLMTVSITEFPLPSNPSGNMDIISGPNNHLWITEGGQPSGLQSKIAEMRTDGSVANEFNISLNGDYVYGQGMATGSDGNLWFGIVGPTDSTGQNQKYGIGTITAAATPTIPAGTETTYTTQGFRPSYAITSDSVGNLWYINTTNYIGKAVPGKGVMEIPVGIPGNELLRDDTETRTIISGPDGNIWFREYGALGKVDLKNNDAISTIPLPTGYTIGTFIDGHDGNLWFRGGPSGSLVTSYDLSTGVFTPYVPAVNSQDNPVGFARTPDGDFWYTDSTFGRIGQFDPTTKATVFYDVPSHNKPWQISIGPDNNLWFTELTGGLIGKVDLNAATPTADLAITATVSPGPYLFGQPLAYKLTITNNGPSAAQTIVATAALPGNVTFSPAPSDLVDLSYNGDTNTVTFSHDTLAAGASVDKTIPVFSNALGTYNSMISVGSPPTFLPPSVLVRDAVADPVQTNNFAPLPPVNVVDATTDLSIAVDGTVPFPASVNVGDPLTYAMTLVNAGPSGAENIVVTDQLPAGVVYTGSIDPTTALSGYAYREDQNLVTYHSFSMPPSPNDGSSLKISIPVKVLPGAAGTTLLNSATVGNATTDSNLANNTVTFTPVSVTGTAAGSDVRVTVAGPTDPVGVNQHVTLTVTIKNLGPDTAQGVHLKEELAGLTFVSTTRDLGTPVNLTSGQSLVYTIDALTTQPSIGNPVFNRATAIVSSPLLATSVTSVTSNLNVLPDADLVVTVTPSANPAYIGVPVTYTVAVTNQGTGSAFGVVVVNQIPAGFSFNPQQKLTFGSTYANGVVTSNLGTIDPHATLLVKFEVTPTAAVFQSIPSQLGLDQASVTATYLKTPIVMTSQVSVPSTPIVTTSGTTAATLDAKSQASLQYTVTITNITRTLAHGYTFTDTLPTGAKLVSAKTGVTKGATKGKVKPPVHTSPSTVTWQVPDLAPGASVTITIKATATAATAAAFPDGNLRNFALVQGSAGSYTDVFNTTLTGLPPKNILSSAFGKDASNLLLIAQKISVGPPTIPVAVDFTLDSQNPPTLSSLTADKSKKTITGQATLTYTVPAPLSFAIGASVTATVKFTFSYDKPSLGTTVLNFGTYDLAVGTADRTSIATKLLAFVQQENRKIKAAVK